MKRIAAFFFIVIVLFAAVVWTTPGILNGIRLGLDLKGGFEILYVAEPLEEGQKITPEVLREAARSLEARANVQGVSEPEVVPEGENRIRVRLAGVENQEELRKILKKPAELTFRGPDGTKEMVGSDFVEGGASVEFNPETGLPYVAIKVKNPDKFTDVTTRLTGKPLAIYLDEELISAPTVNYPITGGEAMITGDFTFKEAERLAGIINLGALPVKLTEKYTQSVGATLGQLSLEQTVQAGIIASVIILLFMIIFYRLPGVIASITLIVYSWLVLLVMYWLDAVLTLPGIAAFVLGVGMAVDANIITAERIKEEIRSGKTILSSLRAGSRHSFRTIMDANITTILAAVVLYYLGTGAIQGFALTLILSNILSILTNVFLARLLLVLLVRSKAAQKPAFYGVKEAEISEL
jgi:SecD/SecF fusion protein